MSFSLVIEIAATLALTALLAESYGVVRRRLLGNVLAPMVLGVIFGLMALVQMFNPMEPFEGIIVDMRNIPIALAGAFLGWRGLLPCLAIAVATRIGLGGVGAVPGCWAMVIAGLAGMIWARKRTNHEARTFGGLLLLGLMMSSHLFAAFLLPHDIAVWFLTQAAGPILLMNLVAVPLIAALLERENFRIRQENLLKAAVTHDPVSGLLTAPAFMREMTNAYAAQPFGTYAGFMTITPMRGFIRTAISLFGEDAPVSLDRQALGNHFEYADLAGLCADGRVLIPLSASEVKHVSRVKADLFAALRSTEFTAFGAAVTLSMVQAAEPEEFLRITDTAVVPANVDWNEERSARKRAAAKHDGKSEVGQASIFNRDDHDVLFAKAEFLIERTQS